MFVVTLSRHVMSCISPGIYIFPYFPTEINVYRISTAITLLETGQGPSMCNSFRHILKVSLKKKNPQTLNVAQSLPLLQVHKKSPTLFSILLVLYFISHLILQSTVFHPSLDWVENFPLPTWRPYIFPDKLLIKSVRFYKAKFYRVFAFPQLYRL